MSKKKGSNGSLPLSAENESMEQGSNITYASEVVAIIAGLAAKEVEGIAGMCNVSGSIMGKNKNVTRGVKVEVGTEEVSVDLYVVVEYGTPIQRAARDAQESVKRSIESMTGLHVVRVDVHVQGVSFEKEMNALQAGAGKANLEAGETAEESAKPEAAAPVTETEPVQATETETEPAQEPEAEAEPVDEDATEEKEEPEAETAGDAPETEADETEPAAEDDRTDEETQV